MLYIYICNIADKINRRVMAGPYPIVVPAAFTSAWWKDCTPMAGAAAKILGSAAARSQQAIPPSDTPVAAM